MPQVDIRPATPDRFDDDAAWENAAAYLEGLGLKRLTYLTFK